MQEQVQEQPQVASTQEAQAIRAVLALNDRGIEFLQQGEYQTASIAFRNALQRVRDLAFLDASREQQQQQQQQQQDVDADEPHPRTLVVWKLQGTKPVADNYQHLDFSCASFDRAFAMTSTTTILSMQPAQDDPQDNIIPPDYELLVVTLLYNTALAYDLRRKRHATLRNHLGSIRRACGLYEQALQVLQVMPQAHDQDAVRALLLAAVNNRAVLALEEQDFETFDVYRAAMQQWVRPHDVFEYDFFACNVLTTARIRQQPAPAA